jgi:hypothetical protein
LAFLVPKFAFAQMSGRQPGSSPGSYPGGAPSGTPNVPDAAPPPAAPERTQRIYITDFELDSASLAVDASAALAHHIVKLMSDNLLKDFAKAGYTTKLLHPSDLRPDDGFLITGVFAQVGGDNRLRLAVVGSGQSAETLQLYVAAKDLAHFTAPLYTSEPKDTDANGAKPGAVIDINPNADAVKYSIEADITDKDIKQSAQRISAELVKRINAAVKAEGDPLNRYA